MAPIYTNVDTYFFGMSDIQTLSKFFSTCIHSLDPQDKLRTLGDMSAYDLVGFSVDTH